jgi:hypothetical protein
MAVTQTAEGAIVAFFSERPLRIGSVAVEQSLWRQSDADSRKPRRRKSILSASVGRFCLTGLVLAHECDASNCYHLVSCGLSWESRRGESKCKKNR